jgi:hypothetical protein
MTALRQSNFGTGYTGGGHDGLFVALQKQSEAAYRSSSPTTSSPAGFFQPETPAERNSKAVRSSRFVTQIGQIKLITGYPWEKIADLLNCSRQSVYNWRDGIAISDANIRAVQRMYEALSFINRDIPVETRAILEANDGAIYNLLKAGKFDDAKCQAGEGVGSKSTLGPGMVKETPSHQDHWTSRIAFAGDVSESDGFPARKVVGKLKMRNKK